MSVLNIKKHKGRFIGGYFNSPIHNYVSLYSLAKEVTKTDIIEDLIIKWIKEQRKTDTEETLLRAIVFRINSGWQVSRVIQPEITFKDYCEDARKELYGKGLTEVQVENIINKLKY
jgi:hypothetical protein